MARFSEKCEVCGVVIGKRGMKSHLAMHARSADRKAKGLRKTGDGKLIPASERFPEQAEGACDAERD